MLKTLRLSFSLKNTYRVNSILYGIKQIPIIRKIIPGTVYQMKEFKIFANILSIMWTIISTFLGKLLYFLLMIFMVSKLYNVPDTSKPALFLHILLILSVIGALANTYMFNPTKDKYYAMILLGMDAKQYTLVNYAFAMFKLLLGFTLCAFLFGLPMGLSAWQCLLIPFFVAGLKMSFTAYDLWEYEKKSAVKNENKPAIFQWIGMFVLLALAYAPPAFGFTIPEYVSVAVMCIAIIAGLVSIRRILTFKNYRAMYKELLTEALITQMDSKAQVKIQQQQSLNNISADKDISSNRKGFEYLNELFIKRHQKILWKSSKIIALVMLVLIAAALVMFQIAPDTKAEINELLMNFLPYFVFIMYAINRGTGFTQALFVNCDHSLLTYSFYKQPKFILKLFQIRLREIIKVNLLPALVIGAGLALLLFASGGTDNPLNYAVLFVSILCLSIFFSVHYLMLYYLLQPYNAGTEIKNGTYKILMSVTYIVCYIMIQIELPTFIFGVSTIIFCILYCLIASLLVYKFAPKTFRIRN